MIWIKVRREGAKFRRAKGCCTIEKTGSCGYKSRKKKAVRRRLLNSNLMMDQAAINAGFDFRRYRLLCYRRRHTPP